MMINNYEQPQCEIIEMQMAEVIAQSGPVQVSSPWSGNDEEEW